MIKKIRVWLAGKLIDLAIYVEFETVLYFTMDVTRILSDMIAEKEAEKAAAAAKPKLGRPFGSKDKAPRRASEGKKLGRPVGSKDKRPRKAGVVRALGVKANDNA
jgi:hypothetical protein